MKENENKFGFGFHTQNCWILGMGLGFHTQTQIFLCVNVCTGLNDLVKKVIRKSKKITFFILFFDFDLNGVFIKAFFYKL